MELQGWGGLPDIFLFKNCKVLVFQSFSHWIPGIGSNDVATVGSHFACRWSWSTAANERSRRVGCAMLCPLLGTIHGPVHEIQCLFLVVPGCSIICVSVRSQITIDGGGKLLNCHDLFTNVTRGSRGMAQDGTDPFTGPFVPCTPCRWIISI